MQFIPTILQTFIMQIISTIPLCNYKVPVITTTKKTSHSVLVNHRKTFQTFSRTFQDLETKFKDFQGLSRTEKKIQDFSRMWQPCW